MTAPYLRRPDPIAYSRGWEAPVLVCFAAIAWLGLAALIGLGLASAWFGRGWVWPHGTSAIGRAFGGLFTGDPAGGFVSSEARRVAGRTAVYACITVCELLALCTGTWACVVATRYRRPADQRSGIASRREATEALGRTQLRAVRSIIRPDLYGKER